MKQNLNILVQSSDYYAPFAGVMLTSLFENNQDVGFITVYLITLDMSEINKNRFNDLAKQYGRKIKFLDAHRIDSFLEKKSVPTWNGAYTTYYKIFALSVIEDEIDRLIYLDSDMLITGSLSELMTCTLGDNILGMCIDAIPSRYKRIIKCNSLLYYNAGMIVFDVKKWKGIKGADKVVTHMSNVRAAYPIVDQDLLNIIFMNQIAIIPQKYNLNSGILQYDSYKFWIKTYGIENYYQEKEFVLAQQDPVILHCMGTFGMRPWCEGEHPVQDMWNQYKNISPWNDFVLLKSEMSGLNKIQYFLFRYCQKDIFSAINRGFFYGILRRKARKLGPIR